MYEYQPILDALNVKPFQPFQIELSNGELLKVTHPEQVWVFPTEIHVTKRRELGEVNLREGFSMIGLDHIVQLRREFDSPV